MRLAFLVIFVAVILFASTDAVSVNADAVAKLTKSSSENYNSVWNKMLAKIFRSLIPKDYRTLEANKFAHGRPRPLKPQFEG
ncbi:hypothetical protein PF010_g21182 [Phytophthora fragariae]|uniref:RxLR effector protein n=1 Tax=Phytophthora fragariae TaxID=53985 RepID=A0A6A3J1D8_9STRA|nr:hypothetical protein PF003_g16845 [Phytophthora fragariae]KAE8934176.1 hypothetical protein PF009_g15837 [Phytophthora fragariae]KAE8986365.1 hypothetical protein PF011_g20013 [Phytophthora fragariae]KAE9083524.1 hypothetical protein PF010_g21182 [Phytophthora fragariae]KAE9107965.1 hypothetical protein PF006_g20985 [Phytophthora fragariae]